MCRQGLDQTLQYIRALQIFPCDTTTVERQRVESQRSMAIIILLLLHSSPDGPPLIIPATSLSPSPFPHIPVFISFPSPPDFVSFGSRQEQRKGDSQKHREIERKQRMTRVTQRDRGMHVEREKEESGFISLKSLCTHWPLLVIAKYLWPANTLRKYVTIISFPFFIPLSQTSPSRHFFNWSLNTPFGSNGTCQFHQNSLTFALIFPYSFMSFFCYCTSEHLCQRLPIPQFFFSPPTQPYVFLHPSFPHYIPSLSLSCPW